MELVIFVVAVFAGAVYGIWRSRTGGTRGKERLVQGLPDDLRDKNYGLEASTQRSRPWGGSGR